MVKQRSPMQVSDEFERKLKKLQSDLMRKNGKNVSLREVTEKIVRSEDFKRVEESLLRDSKIDIQVSLDRRKR